MKMIGRQLSSISYLEASEEFWNTVDGIVEILNTVDTNNFQYLTVNSNHIQNMGITANLHQLRNAFHLIPKTDEDMYESLLPIIDTIYDRYGINLIVESFHNTYKPEDIKILYDWLP